MTKQEVKKHIEENMDKWLFVGHISERHINVEPSELQARLGRYSNEGKLITYASTFIDETYGDDIVAGLTETLKSRAAKILHWLGEDDDPLLFLHFSTFPKGVSGITCNIFYSDVTTADGYRIILCKREQYPFYMLNTYPVSF